jgi:hypothetical protein
MLAAATGGESRAEPRFSALTIFKLCDDSLLSSQSEYALTG